MLPATTPNALPGRVTVLVVNGFPKPVGPAGDFGLALGWGFFVTGAFALVTLAFLVGVLVGSFVGFGVVCRASMICFSASWASCGCFSIVAAAAVIASAR